MGDIILAGSTSGSITVAPPAVAGSGTLTLPTGTDTLVGLAATQTLTNKTLTAPALGTPASGVLTNCTGLPALGHSRVSLTSGNITTTSTSLADLTGATVTFTTGANPIHVSFAATWAQSTAGQTAFFTILVDGASQFGTAGLLYDAHLSGYALSVSCAFDTAALSSGSHTIKVQWKVSAGTGTIYANSANAAILSAHEIL